MIVTAPARRRGRDGRSPGVVALALAAAFLALAAALTSTPAAAAAPGLVPRAFAESDDIARRVEAPGKDALHRVQIVANLRAEAPAATTVLLLGGSSARESTVDDGSWAAGIVAAGGPPVTAHNLGCRHDTFAEDLQIVKLLPRDMPGVVFIGINLGRFANPPKTPTVTLPEPMLPPPAYFQHVYSVDEYVQSRATKAYYVRYWLKARWPEFQERYAYNLRMLERVVDTSLQRGLHPVLLDLPRDLEVIGRSLDRPVAQMKAGCAQIAARYGIPWITPVKGAGLVDGDFFDLWHLVEPGRLKYQAKISAKTVSLLHKYGFDEPAEPAPAPAPTPAPEPTTTPTATPEPTATPQPTWTPTALPAR